DILPDAVMVIDGRRRIVEANPAAKRILHLGEDAIGRRMETPYSIARHLDTLGDVAQKADVEVPELARVFEVASEPLDGRGRPGGRLLVLRDIT
ncbi:PAS domain-containing protein, partial [Mycobacterium tuberculosis]|nr:PAS domain-containing protein [Mycobacterium tuberculosis]